MSHVRRALVMIAEASLNKDVPLAWVLGVTQINRAFAEASRELPSLTGARVCASIRIGRTLVGLPIELADEGESFCLRVRTKGGQIRLRGAV